MSKNTGGPAFPVADPFAFSPGTEVYAKRLAEGMTLRDYFAAKADVSIYGPRQALESKLDRPATMGEVADYIAQIRYLEADAMLAQRSKE